MEPELEEHSLDQMREVFEREVIGKCIKGISADAHGVQLCLIDGTDVFIAGTILGLSVSTPNSKPGVVIQ